MISKPQATFLTVPTWAQVGAIAFVFFFFAQSTLQYAISSDLLPLWMAAQFFATGDTASIYPSAEAFFTLQAPTNWEPAVRALEGVDARNAEVLPYVYPPLWAALLAPLTTVGTYAWLQTAFNVANPLLIVGICILAWRIAPVGSLPRFLTISLLVCATSLVGAVGLMSNQVQILVSFLTLLSIERLRSQALTQAGIALGLAAAIKGFPLVFIVLFWALGARRAVLSFAITGALLGALSIALAGWLLHAAFLEQVSAVSRSVVLVNIATSIDVLIGQVFAMDAAQSFGPREIIEKSSTWSAASKASLLAALVMLASFLRRRPNLAHHPMFWPGAVALLTLLSPLAWAFYFLIPLAFVPVLLAKPTSAILALVGIAATNLNLLYLPSGALGLPYPASALATLGLTLLTGLYLVRSLKEPPPPLHPPDQSL